MLDQAPARRVHGSQRHIRVITLGLSARTVGDLKRTGQEQSGSVLEALTTQPAMIA